MHERQHSKYENNLRKIRCASSKTLACKRHSRYVPDKKETYTVTLINFSERPQVLQHFHLHHVKGISLTARLRIFRF